MTLSALLPARWRADADLLADALAGNNRAIRALVDRLMPQAHAMAWRLTGSSHDAEDVVQEAFLRLWRDGRRLEARAQVSTWFLTVVRNLCFDRLRRAGNNDEVASGNELLDESPTPEQALLDKADARQLQAALARLPPRQRGALMMWAWQDYDVKEIATALEIDANAAHQLLFRARRALRKQFDCETKAEAEDETRAAGARCR